ncbi:hypothetical protein OBBRIDRAFT_380379 [Obba rivulosa]|uniref:Uncharacterized protein n=1 Tax=Obba rivulosa TaxID=1052685 RepID=A0A8E2DLY7_9APHY|nr:hypothetical protein OBBRIDRAFT_380379 [Obba rivulosa]
MADRPSLVDSTTPSSDTLYFDAPLAHFGKMSESGETTPQASPPSEAIGTIPSGAPDAEEPVHVKKPGEPSILRLPREDDEPAKSDGGADTIKASTRSKLSTNTAAPKDTMSDSGYDSATGERDTPAARPGSRASQASAGILQPIPVVWAESPVDAPPRSVSPWKRSQIRRAESPEKRPSSLRSFATDPLDRESIRTAAGAGWRSPAPGERRRRRSLTGGSFASGAGTVGPSATPRLDDSFHARSASADAELTNKQKAKLDKETVKEGKRMAKVIKSEAKAEKKALEEAVKELAEIQKLQRLAIKDEAKIQSAHAKAVRSYHKEELEFFAARAKFEKAQAELQAQEDAREAARNHAQEVTEMLQEKNREVEWLRAQKAVDDREREAKLAQLAGK